MSRWMTGASPGRRNVSRYILRLSSTRKPSNLNVLFITEPVRKLIQWCFHATIPHSHKLFNQSVAKKLAIYHKKSFDFKTSEVSNATLQTCSFCHHKINFKNCGGVPNPLEIYGNHSFTGDRALGYYHW